MEYPNLPYLIDGETKITETAAILQYIAKKWKPDLLGRSAAEVGRVNMLWYYVLQLTRVLGETYKEGADAEAIIDKLRPMLQKLVEAMGEHSFIAGDELTWLDFYFAEMVDKANTLSDGLFLAEFPSLQSYWDRFTSLPNLAEAWADDSKLMKAPFNNKHAALMNC